MVAAAVERLRQPIWHLPILLLTLLRLRPPVQASRTALPCWQYHRLQAPWRSRLAIGQALLVAGDLERLGWLLRNESFGGDATGCLLLLLSLYKAAIEEDAKRILLLSPIEDAPFAAHIGARRRWR